MVRAGMAALHGAQVPRRMGTRDQHLARRTAAVADCAALNSIRAATPIEVGVLAASYVDEVLD